MWFLITLLWIMVAYRVVGIIAFHIIRGETIVTNFDDGTIAARSWAATASAVVLAFAAVVITDLSSQLGA